MENRRIFRAMERGDTHDGQSGDCKWSTARYIHKSEDVVTRHRIQSWTQPTKPPGVMATIVNNVKTEGITSLWRGFLPYYSRAAPNTVITMVCVDQLHRMYSTFFPGSQ
ncbi:PREDICTED: mitochondrial 2-oxoglutarate/malate carrier protein-like [Vollenhovia emeryi]|uniref:mitochondrial 2-oxoglutarate/malate carrier protein-like n=1 Tax=Vollenhovia emeryi TaxID=411798 RepID=UPI0005F3D474|nr:PREDICTED: mitochondrial 2-oxoglutarate/malate carrier protein-like [Vollenhovia emeryi]